jgi:hypothetical protein
MNGDKVGVRILLDREIDAARGLADEFVTALSKERKQSAREVLERDPAMYEREAERALIYHAFVVPDELAPGKEPEPFFPNVVAVRQMDSVLVRQFSEIYAEHQNFVSPKLGEDDVDLEELIDDLGKESGAEVSLAVLAVPTLWNCIRTLAARVRTLRTGK